MEATAPPGGGLLSPQKGNIVLVKLDAGGGTKVVNIENIRDVTIKGELKARATEEEIRATLTLKLEKAGKEADVGLMYVQRGLRWIPSYKIAIDGKGTAAVRLQATIINELADLDDVTANLVIGGSPGVGKSHITTDGIDLHWTG